jgi:hypothetical protein
LQHRFACEQNHPIAFPTTTEAGFESYKPVLNHLSRVQSR